MNKLYLVTGANGHLGNTIVRLLRQQFAEVRALILPSDSDKMLRNLGASIYRGDVRKKETLQNFFDLSGTSWTMENVILIHTAGIISIKSKKTPLMIDVNVNGTKNICELCMDHKVSRMIYISSVHAIPELKNNEVMSEINQFDPNLVIGDYAKTKATATQMVLNYLKLGLNAIIIHPSGIIGPYDFGHGHMTMMIEDYLNGYLTSRINGAYDFVDVRDVAQGILSASRIGTIGETYILSGHRIDLKDLFEHLRLLSGKKHKIHVLPTWFAKLTAPLAEIYYKLRKLPPIYTTYSLYTIESNSYFSHQKASSTLNYHTRDIAETLLDTMRFLVDQNRIKRHRIILFIKQLSSLKKTRS